MILYHPQYLLEDILDPYKMSPDACHAREKEKNRPKSFVTEEVAFWFKNLCFQSTS